MVEMLIGSCDVRWGRWLCYIGVGVCAWGHNWATLFLGDINTGTWPSGLKEALYVLYVLYSVCVCGKVVKDKNVNSKCTHRQMTRL
jgi:hypothetical protein